MGRKTPHLNGPVEALSNNEIRKDKGFPQRRGIAKHVGLILAIVVLGCGGTAAMILYGDRIEPFPGRTYERPLPPESASADATERIVKAKVCQAVMDSEYGLKVEIVFANQGDRSIFIEDAHGMILQKFPSELDGDSATTKNDYYDCEFETADSIEVAPGSTEIVTFYLREPDRYNFPDRTSLALPAYARDSIESPPTGITPKPLLHMILKVSVQPNGASDIKTMPVVARFAITGAMSGTEGSFLVATGDIWPSNWKEVREGGFDPNDESLNHLLSEMQKAATPLRTFDGKVVPFESSLESL